MKSISLFFILLSLSISTNNKLFACDRESKHRNTPQYIYGSNGTGNNVLSQPPNEIESNHFSNFLPPHPTSYTDEGRNCYANNLAPDVTENVSLNKKTDNHHQTTCFPHPTLPSFSQLIEDDRKGNYIKTTPFIYENSSHFTQEIPEDNKFKICPKLQREIIEGFDLFILKISQESLKKSLQLAQNK